MVTNNKIRVIEMKWRFSRLKRLLCIHRWESYFDCPIYETCSRCDLCRPTGKVCIPDMDWYPMKRYYSTF